MIVISGALVLVALVLLVLGLTMTDLDFVYGSIAVSLVSFVFLVIGILQRRGEQPATAGGPEVSTGSDGDKAAGSAAPPTPVPVTTTTPAAARTAAVPVSAGSAVVVDDDDDDEVYDDDLEPGGGPVLIVPGRPRYHVDGCRYLTGKEVEEIDVLDARDDGFTPCGVCKPDEVLEELYGPLLEDEVEDDDVVDSGVPGAEDVIDEPEPEPVVAAPAKKAAAKKAAADKAPAKQAGSAKAAPATATVAAATADTAAPAKAAAARGRVVVIPDRGRFHTPVCRFVRDALGTEELTRTQAAKQGYQACGVCKP